MPKVFIPKMDHKHFLKGEVVPRGKFSQGDFILVRGKSDFIDQFIEWGERFRFHGDSSKYAVYTHAALIENEQGGLIEALSNGIVRSDISKYQRTEYTLVNIGATREDRIQAVEFAQACLGEKYGFMKFFSIGVSLLTGLKFSFGFDGEEVCSGLVARSLERTGAIFPHDPSHISPADLAAMYNVL